MPSRALEERRRSGITWTNYHGGRGARSHSQDSRANSVGCLRPQRCSRKFGNQEVHTLLPDAKAWHLTYHQGSTSLVAASFSRGERSSNRIDTLHALVISRTRDLDASRSASAASRD